MMFDQRFRLRPAPAERPAPLVAISEEGTGVFVATCHDCGHVVGVRRTRAEVERDKAAHVCGERTEGSPLLRYLTLT
ncbi:MAG TPA: hypothetical protein VFP36_15930 [Usitatibacter sp.]|nr:hypothetical protein [Usitatibacter sp.]